MSIIQRIMVHYYFVLVLCSPIQVHNIDYMYYLVCTLVVSSSHFGRIDFTSSYIIKRMEVYHLTCLGGHKLVSNDIHRALVRAT